MPPEFADGYFQRYHLHYPGSITGLAKVSYDGGHVALHYALKPKPSATVLLLHGYLDHSVALSRLAAHLNAQGYSVVLADLPGHGLSSGPRGDIDEFASYRAPMRALVESLKSVSTKLNLVCTSTGCSAAIEAMAGMERAPYHRVVMINPLLRSIWWKWSKVGLFLTDPFMDDIFRRWEKPCRGCRELKSDPLQVRRVPFGWIKALYRWDEVFDEREFPPLEGMVLQGDNDETVWWKHNRPRFEKQFPQLSWEILPGARHMLFESDRYYPVLESRVDECFGVGKR